MESESCVATRRRFEGASWAHFASGDRVLVFGAPDPAGRRRVRHGTVLAPPAPDTIEIAFEDGTHEEFSPADPIRVSHAAGACRCVTVLR